ncbi:Aldo/keto reductase [Macrolepiota fuliginosa MF-IS2]|uniref:Aldo/keto reductase n=1 Tax=Macrolepiota fuliginosa MF-IS2 TaxID=1400762 RepID=A0A9P6C035_9AGAR|nr:Aldo/keto reductase [Macrolepiota fuliginosa MF-IS2]
MTSFPPPREFSRMGPVRIPRIWTGLWQLSSSAWGSADIDDIKKSMKKLVDNGYCYFDIADHYGSAENIIGQFRHELPDPTQLFIATKWCVFHRCIPTREVVLEAVKSRLRDLQTTRIDLLQFHWQNYNDKAYLDALLHLRDLQTEGYIANIGLCNFDAKRADEICTQLGPGAIVSNQVQFSIIDTRPLHGMGDVCMKHGLKLLTYGTLCGNFLTDKWLGQSLPDPYGEENTLTPSQRKYLDVILISWGTWELFQDLLRVLRAIGDRHGGLSIANVATRWVLDHPFVGGVLIGARLGITEHFADNAKVFNFRLTPQDRTDIEEVLARSNSRRMITIIGDCGAEYRD